MLNKIKGAIFDMDGTLIDSLMLWEVIWEAFGQKYCGGKKFCITAEQDKAFRTMTLKEVLEYINDTYKLADSVDELHETANSVIYDFYANEVKLKAGVEDFLECCAGRGIKMCIASATEMSLIKVAMKHCGLDKYFSHVLSCADIGKGKDQPDIYLDAVKALGTEISETCVFEDSQVAVCTAHKIGMLTVGIYDKYNYGQDIIKSIADEYIADGETLKKLIK